MDKALAKAMGLEAADETDFGPSLAGAYYINDVPVTKEELDDHKRAEAAQKQEMLIAEWEAEIDAHNLSRLSEYKPRSHKMDFVCGCDREVRFSATLFQLAKLPEGRCPGCNEFKGFEALEAVLKKRGGKRLEGYDGALTKIRFACAEGHEWVTTPSSITNKGTWCPQCHNRIQPRLSSILKSLGGRMITPYDGSQKKVTFECALGHRWDAMPTNIVHRGSWCPTCAKPTTGSERLSEILAERGWQLVDYGTPSDQTKMATSPDGDPQVIYHSQFLKAPPLYKAFRRHRIRVFYDDENMTSFVLMGRIPPLLPSAIADIIRKGDFEEVHADTSQARLYKVLPQVIADENAGDYRPVNVLGNPEWKSPGTYSWGSFPPFHNTLTDMKEN